MSVESKKTDFSTHWAQADITEFISRGIVQRYEDGSFHPDQSISKTDFYTMLNKAIGYQAVDDTNVSNETISRGESAKVICKMLNISGRRLESNTFTDVPSMSQYSQYIGALVYYNIVNDEEEKLYRPDDALTRAEAVTMLYRAIETELIVKNNSSTVIRDMVSLDMGAPAKIIDSKLYVPLSFGSLALGGSTSYDSKTGFVSIIVNNKELSSNSIATIEGSTVYVPLEQVCNYFDSNSITTENDTTTVKIDRYKLKSNRDLTPDELKLSYAKYYIRYWDTPLGERPDEKAWVKKNSLFQESSQKPNNSLLKLSDINNLLDPNYEDQEGWCFFDDGTASLSIETEMPDFTPEMFSWWFAWHPLRDVRYMTWYPPSHYSIWAENGTEYKDDAFRLTNDSLSITERTYGVVHHVNETMVSSTNGNPAYYNLGTNGTNSQLISPSGKGGLNFCNPTFIGFNADEFHKQSEAGQIAAVAQYPPTPDQGAVMCHFLRTDKNGHTKLHTHFWFGCTVDSQTGKVIVSKTGANSKALLSLAYHGVHEFANLSTILPDIYDLEGKDKLDKLSETADSTYYGNSKN